MIYLTAAFVLLWLLVVGYVAFLLARQRALERELRSLQEQLEEDRQRRI